MATGFDNVPPIGQQLADNILEGNLGGIFSTRPTAKYMSGARCVLRINGRIVGFAFNITWRVNTSYTAIETIDNVLPEELAPRRVQVDGSIAALHVPGQGAGVQLWQPDILSFLFHEYLVVEVRDSVTDQLLFYAPKAVITSRQEDIRVDELAQVSLNFMAIGFRDEKNPEGPDGINTRSGQTKLGDHYTEQQSTLNKGSSLVSSVFGV